MTHGERLTPYNLATSISMSLARRSTRRLRGRRAHWRRRDGGGLSGARPASRSRRRDQNPARRAECRPDRLRRFEQEARAAAALNHPNILAVFDIGHHEGVPYIVSELLDGETLRERLASGVLPVRKTVEFGVQIARGFAAAHEKGITHRDLKPDNVFVTSDGRVKILDFGLAKLTQSEPGIAAVSALPTTPPARSGDGVGAR